MRDKNVFFYSILLDPGTMQPRSLGEQRMLTGVTPGSNEEQN